MKFIKSLETEEEQLEAVKESIIAIRYIQNPSEQVQLEAVKQYPWAIGFIHNPSEQVLIKALNQNIQIIEDICPSINIQNLYLSYCLKHNEDIHQKLIKDLDQNKIKNLIDCKNLII